MKRCTVKQMQIAVHPETGVRHLFHRGTYELAPWMVGLAREWIDAGFATDPDAPDPEPEPVPDPEPVVLEEYEPELEELEVFSDSDAED